MPTTIRRRLYAKNKNAVSRSDPLQGSDKEGKAQEFEFGQQYLKNFQFETSTGHIRQPHSILDYCQPRTFSS
jgi:hypothetical protein